MTEPPRTPPAPSDRAHTLFYWACQGGGWLLLAASVILMNGGAAPPVLARLAGVYLWAAVVGIGVTHAWRSRLRRGGMPRPLPLAAWLAGMSVLMTLSTTLGFMVFQPHGPVRGWAWFPAAVTSWVGVLGIWTMLYALSASARRARRLRADALRHQAQAQQAELRALQAKVNPHFFFNSLNSLRALVYEDQGAAARMIDQLAMLMRYSLGSGELRTVPLAQELDAVRAYLAIEGIRFEDRLRASIDVAPDLEALPIPPMTLQTLVENAVKYGVEPSTDGSDVRIAARRDGSVVELSVANQGALRTSSNSTRVGLDNVRERLALALAEPSTLSLDQRDGWVVASIRIGAAP